MNNIKPQKENYFALFGLKTDFTIDLKDLEHCYLRLQSEFHPDSTSNSSFEQIERSIKINEAFRILSDDFLRACYLLDLQGIDILNDEQAVKVEAKILAEIFGWQEKLEEINEISALNAAKNQVEQEFSASILQFSKLYSMQHFEESSQFLIRARYLQKIQHEFATKLRTFSNSRFGEPDKSVFSRTAAQVYKDIH